MFVSAKQKLELSCQNDDLVQEDQSPVQCLKLFGKTLLVKDCVGTSDSTLETCLDRTEKKCSSPKRVVPLKFPAKGPVVLAWLTLSNQEVHNPMPIKDEAYKKKEKKMDKNEENEVSSSSSGSTSNRDRRLSNKRSSASFEDCRKGFVPYKRRASEREKNVCLYVENTDFCHSFL